MESRNAYFQLDIREDGVYLKIFPPVQDGFGILLSDIDSYLAKRGIDYNKDNISATVSRTGGPQEIKLTEKKIYPVNEIMEVYAKEDRTEARARFYPPSNGGTLLNFEEIMGILGKNAIKYGINDVAVTDFLRDRKYCTDYVIASATMPVPGKEAVITYNFNCDVSRKPKTNEDGSVDFHQIDIVSHVNVGDLLATLEPAVEGKPGKNISGVEMIPPKVQVKNLKYGKNIKVSEDGLKLYSEVNGHVSLVNDTVFVTDIYKVPANVDNSTGDISYNGNVEVAGNVNTGFKIEAKGDIIVNGVVEGATLIAGGQIILHRGIQGMSKGELVANGNIITKFIENATVRAGGYITTEAIMHSKVFARGDITVGGKKGLITGGEIKSTTVIAAKNIGSVMGTPTSMEVGVDPEITEEMNELDKKISEISAEVESINQVLTRYAQILRTGAKLDPAKATQVKLLAKQKDDMEKQKQEMMDRTDLLYDSINESTGGCIRVEGTIYPGCKMTISGVMTFVRAESKYCRFIREGADIKMTAY